MGGFIPPCPIRFPGVMLNKIHRQYHLCLPEIIGDKNPKKVPIKFQTRHVGAEANTFENINYFLQLLPKYRSI